MVYPSIYETFILRTPHIPSADIATPRFNHSSPHLSYNTLCLRALAGLALQRSATGDRLLQPPPTPRPATSLAGAALADGPAQEGHALGPRRLHLVPLVHTSHAAHCCRGAAAAASGRSRRSPRSP